MGEADRLMVIFNLKYDVRETAPTISRFHWSNHAFRIICGPIGGGKSVACCVEIFRRCKEQLKGPDGLRRSRWLVVRNTKSQLKDTTLKTWFDWFPPGVGIGRWAATDSTFYFEFGDVRAEILFRALDTPDDVAKVLSLELTGAWLNECREIPQEIVEGLQGRLERYPSQAMGGSNYWMLLADTNPPEEESYWWRLMEHMPLEGNDMDTVVDCDVFKQPSGLSPEAENLKNLNPGYYSSKAKGRSKAWVDVYLHAKYAISQSGKPVYHTSFRKDRHVSPVSLIPDPVLPVIVGVDAGLTPAASFRQMGLDGRIRVLREAVEFDMGMKRFAKYRLRPIIKNFFPTNPIIFVMDPSSKKRSDGDEEVTAFKKLKTEFIEEEHIIVKTARTNNLSPRIQATEEALSQWPEGEPLLLIDPSCTWTIAGYQTKYRYPKRKITGDYGDSPEKNEWSHIIEAGQYGDLFLLSPKYDPMEYVIDQARTYNPFPQQGYRPALREGY